MTSNEINKITVTIIHTFVRLYINCRILAERVGAREIREGLQQSVMSLV